MRSIVISSALCRVNEPIAHIFIRKLENGPLEDRPLEHLDVLCNHNWARRLHERKPTQNFGSKTVETIVLLSERDRTHVVDVPSKTSSFVNCEATSLWDDD